MSEPDFLAMARTCTRNVRAGVTSSSWSFEVEGEWFILSVERSLRGGDHQGETP